MLLEIDDHSLEKNKEALRKKDSRHLFTIDKELDHHLSYFI